MDWPSPLGRSLFFPKTTTPLGDAGGNETNVSHPKGVLIELKFPSREESCRFDGFCGRLFAALVDIDFQARLAGVVVATVVVIRRTFFRRAVLGAGRCHRRLKK